ncbi:MAG: hypothetical protein ACP5HG_08380 [Anaerolineae bacterium]
MYRDDIWYRRLQAAVEEHRDGFTDKQWNKYRIGHLLRVADRVREFSDTCETCKEYQHTLTRLEEELQELPDSKAQRQYQREQLVEMGRHFVAEHELAPPFFFLRKWLKQGLRAGIVLGLVLAIGLANGLFLPIAGIAGAVLGAIYGFVQDQRYEREHRRI